jgi:hypothetical protein
MKTSKLVVIASLSSLLLASAVSHAGVKNGRNWEAMQSTVQAPTEDTRKEGIKSGRNWDAMQSTVQAPTEDTSKEGVKTGKNW